MLKIENINTGYDKKQVLFDLSMDIQAGEIVSIIGPNGAGKSTILKAISGLLPIWNGDIVFNNNSIKGNSPSKNIAFGLTFCPQGNRVFDELNVLENLEIGGYLLSKKQLKDGVDRIFQIFPVLKERLKQSAGNLSGGEKQMLALARALIPSPNLLLLDEPSLGLAPNLLGNVFRKLVEINQEFNLTMLIVEQKVKEILTISHEVYSIKLGKVSFKGKPEELKNNKMKIKELFL